jgi:hypothetical protein
MAKKSDDNKSIYIWDLKQEAIVCLLKGQTSNINNSIDAKSSGIANNPTSKQVVEGALLRSHMYIEEVLQLVGPIYSKLNLSDSFMLFLKMLFVGMNMDAH